MPVCFQKACDLPIWPGEGDDIFNQVGGRRLSSQLSIPLHCMVILGHDSFSPPDQAAAAAAAWQALEPPACSSSPNHNRCFDPLFLHCFLWHLSAHLCLTFPNSVLFAHYISSDVLSLFLFLSERENGSFPVCGWGRISEREKRNTCTSKLLIPLSLLLFFFSHCISTACQPGLSLTLPKEKEKAAKNFM